METEPIQAKSSKLFHNLSLAAIWISLVLGLFAIILFWIQFDSLAALTIIPAWLWWLAGILSLFIGRKSSGLKWIKVGALLIWLCFFILFVEEAKSLTRSTVKFLFHDKTGQQDQFRVVSLNCHFGNLSAAQEAIAQTADIILFQEAPGDEKLAMIANKAFGDDSNFVSCGDAAIVSRGRLVPIHASQGSHFVHAVVELEIGEKMIKLDVVSLRLSPPVFQMDFWRSSFWQAHTQRRKDHRRELEEVISHLKNNHVSDRWLIGGDFNLPSGDGALSSMKGMTDSFLDAGTGWCNTATSDWPLFRVDQLWRNDGLETVRLKAKRSLHSDHRMVIGDFKLSR
jgi:endonuclease/exonuclease/phosphatase (EEP) superfamily protein YafD